MSPALQVLSLLSSVLALPAIASASAVPLVSLDYGAFQGFSSAQNTESFLGIPFAQPPVGQLRFNYPHPPPQPFSGIQNATWFGDACPQQPILAPNESLPTNQGLSGLSTYLAELQPQSLVNSSEDCLYLNVVRPAGVSAGADPPVVVWIYGGGFENGDASGYNGTQFVARSVSLKSPVIYVSFNYRLNAFGFLGGKEVQAAGLGNIGLYDQRFALQWIQQYIGLFGGNSEQVIIWGQSAGSISVMLQMVAYDGEVDGLFQGGFMESGSASPLHDITFPQLQGNYDFLVEQTNCTNANDTLNCLRQAPYESLLNAVLETPALLSYQALNASWQPSVDGIFLKQSIRQSLYQGKYARVPAILGDVDDEGTLFSLYSFNVTTDGQFVEYIQTNFLVGATDSEMLRLEQVYPNSSALGSPYDVGTNDTLTPEYKRIASFQGDFYFQLPRRYALRYLSRTQNTWSYLWKRDKFIPGIGSFHESDLQEFYNLTGNSDWVGTDALVNFAYTLNPNAPPNGYPAGAVSSLLSSFSWPQYFLSSPQLLTLMDPDIIMLTNDTYRSEAFTFLNKMQDRMDL